MSLKKDLIHLGEQLSEEHKVMGRGEGTTSPLKSELIRLGAQLSEEDNAAHDLWSWLPSHRVAEKHHGDYAVEYQPSMAELMKEASMYLAHLKHPGLPLTPEEQDWFERCPCGDIHGEAVP